MVCVGSSRVICALSSSSTQTSTNACPVFSVVSMSVSASASSWLRCQIVHASSSFSVSPSPKWKPTTRSFDAFTSTTGGRKFVIASFDMRSNATRASPSNAARLFGGGTSIGWSPLYQFSASSTALRRSSRALLRRSTHHRGEPVASNAPLPPAA
jgi:hypothetical protein